jgi:hypothetical protein
MRTQHRLNMSTLSPGATEQVPPSSIDPMSTARSTEGLSATAPSGDVVTASGRAGETRVEVRRSGGGSIACRIEACGTGRVVALQWRPGRDEILFTRQDANYRQSLHLFSPQSGRVRTVATGDGLLSGGRSQHLPCALTSLAAICVAAGSVSPPRLERIDLETGRRTLLLDPNSAVRARAAPGVEQLAWSLADGRRVTGTLLLPPGRAVRRAPLFVTYYQCPGYLRGGVGDEFPLAPLAGAGLVAVCLNMVPFDQWGDGVDRYRAGLAAVQSLVELLAGRELIDRARVGMGGFSAGSEATMWVAMNSTLLAAAAVASPQYEPAAYWMGAIRGRDNPRVMREFMQLGTPEDTPDRWKLVAPALNVERIKAPLLMQLPEQEVRSAAELYARLSNTGTPVELYAFPDEAHVKIQPRHRLALYRRNLDWFRFWLEGYTDPDPGRAQQYRRWDLLRRRQTGSAAE